MLEGSKIHDITSAKAKGLVAAFIIAISTWSLEYSIKKKRVLDSPVISLDPFPSIISITSLSTHEFLTHRYLKL
jgi:hypothetical protein